MNYVILILGFILLIKGADFFVDGAAAIAKKIGIPAVIIGLTIVSLGTSAPELAVSVMSSIRENNEITMGNVLGSNIFNTIAVLGATAIVAPLIIEKKTIKKDLFVNLTATLLLYALAFLKIFGSENTLTRFDGFILISLCIIYIVYLIYSVKQNNKESIEKDIAMEAAVESQKINLSNKILIAIVGVLGIIFGGKLVVDSATNIAYNIGLSEKLVGLTIVAIGTSLPELVTSLVAAKKGENEIALGNILGSNTFNILLILGLASFISPMAISSALITDLLFLIFITLLVAGLIFANKKEVKILSKPEGLMLIFIYIGYTIFIIMRN
ncbi:calcium/sodium antiporter [Clostridium tarantellae]|uniref:Calcium/sodium antiporter n=1 Tax=Clostridium tarantellae TaxID=39493 RepID=A0A6I1MNC3_9CLOT|nr:calcium/sodium antiporter [Clostridium tarantellae]MPQ44905.1 calcium/sodium antiporter [Clostridium tarantellae]